MTYVFGGMLNLAQSINLVLVIILWADTVGQQVKGFLSLW